MQDGSTIRNGYALDLDTLTVASRIGMMRCSDGTLHYYLDGVDQGVACTDIAPGGSTTVFAIISTPGIHSFSTYWTEYVHFIFPAIPVTVLYCSMCNMIGS